MAMCTSGGCTSPATTRGLCGKHYMVLYRQQPGHKEKHVLYCRERARSMRRFLASVKLTAGCIDCGYNTAAAALHFDHLGDKNFWMFEAAGRSMKVVIEEIMKCVIRCANCHAERHANE